MTPEEIQSLSRMLMSKPSLTMPDVSFLERSRSHEFLQTTASLYLVKFRIDTASKGIEIERKLLYDHIEQILLEIMNPTCPWSCICEARVIFILNEMIRQVGFVKNNNSIEVYNIECMVEEVVEKLLIIPTRIYERVQLAIKTSKCL
jgi:hypothetical protein